MANPRKIIDHRGQGFRAFTFLVDGTSIVHSATAKDGSASAGLAVGLVAGTEDTVELVVDGQNVLGRLLHVEADGTCAVQVEGVCELAAGNGATVTRGAPVVGALGAASARGYVRAIAPATLADVAQGRHRILKAADPTKMQIHLGV